MDPKAVSELDSTSPTAVLCGCEAGRKAADMDRKEHWQRVYETKAPDAVSWFQETPTVSARLLHSAGLGPAT